MKFGFQINWELQIDIILLISFLKKGKQISNKKEIIDNILFVRRKFDNKFRIKQLNHEN